MVATAGTTTSVDDCWQSMSSLVYRMRYFFLKEVFKRIQEIYIWDSPGGKTNCFHLIIHHITSTEKILMKFTKRGSVLIALAFTIPFASTPAVASAEVTNQSATELSEAQRAELREMARLARAQGQPGVAAHFNDRADGISNRGIGSWARKAAVYTLRHYGHKLPAKIRPYASKIAAVLEQVTVWQKMAVMWTLMQHGVPYDVAEATATWIEWTVGF